jgi:ferredoxin
MKIIADKNRCAGHARCAAVADQLFELDSNGYIAFQEKDVPAGAEELARRGVRACRERALKIAANDTGSG